MHEFNEDICEKETLMYWMTLSPGLALVVQRERWGFIPIKRMTIRLGATGAGNCVSWGSGDEEGRG